jgi:hypothetical protein
MSILHDRSGRRLFSSWVRGMALWMLDLNLTTFVHRKYVVSSSIIPYYYTQLIGDARSLPTLVASAHFDGIAVIDADPYTATGQWYDNTNNLYVHGLSLLWLYG